MDESNAVHQQGGNRVTQAGSRAMMAGANLFSHVRQQGVKTVAGKALRRVGFARDHLWVPPGHFYSPLPAPSEVERYATTVWRDDVVNLPGIDLRLEALQALLHELAPLFGRRPFSEHPKGELDYGFDNPNFAFGDGSFWHLVLRWLRPKSRGADTSSSLPARCTCACSMATT